VDNVRTVGPGEHIIAWRPNDRGNLSLTHDGRRWGFRTDLKRADVTDGSAVTVSICRPQESALVEAFTGISTAAGLGWISGINRGTICLQSVGIGRTAVIGQGLKLGINWGEFSAHLVARRSGYDAGGWPWQRRARRQAAIANEVEPLGGQSSVAIGGLTCGSTILCIEVAGDDGVLQVCCAEVVDTSPLYLSGIVRNSHTVQIQRPSVVDTSSPTISCGIPIPGDRAVNNR
jgi:hypothetical protein